jgi:hypothetical protein
MACCILVAAAIGVLLAIKARLLGRTDRGIDALMWRLRRIDDGRSR